METTPLNDQTSNMEGNKERMKYVLKRDGTPEQVDFEKIHWRIKSLCALPTILEFQKKERPEAFEMNKNLQPLLNVSPSDIALKTFGGLKNNISTPEIDIFSADIAQSLCTEHPEYSELAKRILVSNMQKNTQVTLEKIFPNVPKEEIKRQFFRYSMEALYINKNKKGEQAPLVAPYMLAIARKYADRIESMIDYSRDYTNHGYLGIKTLEKGYLFTCNSIDGFDENKILIERSQVAEMRVALAIIASPEPCQKWYELEDVLYVIAKNDDCIKLKYRTSNNSELLNKLRKSKNPHKEKYIDVKVFKQRYWKYMLKNVNSDLSEEELSDIQDTYDKASTGLYTAATPTRFNYGSLKPQGSSCFLIAMEDDSIDGIYNTLKKFYIIIPKA